jgi:hypothetical protein
VGPEYVFVLFIKVLTYYGDDANLCKVARRQREVSCRSAQAAIYVTGRTFDAVICDRTDDDDRH